MTCLRKTSQIGQICLIFALIFFSAMIPAISQATPPASSPTTDSIATQALLNHLKVNGAQEGDLYFLANLIERFGLTQVIWKEAKSSLKRIQHRRYELEGHQLELSNLSAREIWQKVLHVINVSSPYEENPWMSFFDSTANSPERHATILSLAIIAWDELGWRTPASR